MELHKVRKKVLDLTDFDLYPCSSKKINQIIRMDFRKDETPDFVDWYIAVC